MSGVEVLHEAGIPHRDLNPENIFVGNDGSLKICGYGFSNEISTSKTDSNKLVESLEYTSYEVLNGEPRSIPADIWSIGCILYELCSLEKLFHIDHSKDNLTKVEEYKKFIKEDLDLESLEVSYTTNITSLFSLMLRHVPKTRMTSSDLLGNKIFQDLHPASERYYSGGERYVGTIIRSKREKHGTYYFANGDKYEGEWCNDRRHGKGVMYKNNGTEYNQEYDNGNF